MRESDLLAAVLAAPGDDRPRQVYADWLMERGDPRGELVALQCQPQTPALAWRVRELLGEHERQWLDELGLRPGEGALVRGFVEELTLTEERLEQLPDLGQQAPVRLWRLVKRTAGPPRLELLDRLPGVTELELEAARGPLRGEAARQLAERPELARLRALRLRDARGGWDLSRALSVSPHLRELRVLDLAGNQLERAVAHLYQLSRLRELDLSQNQIDDDGVGVMVMWWRQPELRRLSLAHNRISHAGLRSLLRSPLGEGLLELDLSFNPLGAAGPRAMGRVPRPPRLVSLDLRDCLIGDEGASWLADLPSLDGLVRLQLAGNQIGPRGALALARSPHLGSLAELDLSDNPLTDEGAAHLAQSLHLRRLQALGLRHTGLRREGVGALVCSDFAAGLVRLDLGVNRLGEPGARALSRSPHLGRLAVLRAARSELGVKGANLLIRSRSLAHGLLELHLAANEIGGARLLPGSPPLEGLRLLDLSGNPLEATGARRLGHSLHLGALLALRLDDTQLRDEGLCALARSPLLARLVQLDLAHNGLGPEAARALAHAAAPRLADLDLSDNPLTDEGLYLLLDGPLLAVVRSLGLGGCQLGPGAARALLGSPHLGPSLQLEGMRGSNLEGAVLDELDARFRLR
jgi:uncharacterized protein (TIGR02996 family)